MSSTKPAQIDFGDRLNAAPAKPGVYIMRDASDTVIYVGKAKSLRHRLRSYFSNLVSLAPKTRIMVPKVTDFELIITETETEALILENNLIKRYQPAYNVRLKDDKTYPYIKIDASEDFPLVYITRKVSKDGARYFGPFASARSVRKTLALLKKLFPYRSCTKTITGIDTRPCLDFHINRCVGPCIGAVDRQGYSEVINQVVLFLEGKTDRVTKSILKRMEEASEALEFERAAALRDQYQAIEKVQEKQRVLHTTSENLDVIATAPAAAESWVEIFFIRGGKLIGRDNFIMAGTNDTGGGSILTAFVQQFYNDNPYVPPLILVQHELEQANAVEAWLETKRHGAVKLRVPRRGEKKKLVNMVAENASHGVREMRVKQPDSGLLETGMVEVQEALSLPRLPRRIECYDISNIQGTNAVGSMVVFENGKPNTSDYRRFKIKAVEGVDDYSMMREVLTRRFKRLGVTNGINGPENYTSEPLASSPSQGPWTTIPDLVLIDGGRGHLSAALQVFLELGTDHPPLASLAKENEEIFVPQVPEPIVLPSGSQGLFLVQRARDEAHRFAITFHRSRRSKGGMASILDSIDGIGPKRKRLLLRKFGSVEGIKSASIEDIAVLPTMTIKIATTLKQNL